MTDLDTLTPADHKRIRRAAQARIAQNDEIKQFVDVVGQANPDDVAAIRDIGLPG